MSKVIDMITMQEHVPMRGADLEKIALQYFEEQVSETVLDLEMILSCLEKVRRNDWEVLRHVGNEFDYSSITVTMEEIFKKIIKGDQL